MPNAPRRLSEQTMVLTGATSGIGLVTARLAAAKGAKLVLAARNTEALEELARELSATDVETVVADVGIEEDVRRIAKKAIERFGGFDTWVNNAGVSIYGEVEQVSIEDHKRLFDTNYWGVVYGSRIALEHLRQRGGALITIGSVLSDRAVPLQGAYSASKHAVKGFIDALRMEVQHAHANVSVTLIKPSAIDTPYARHARNYFEVEPDNPAPVYSPRLVAEAILYAAEYPVREITVGGGGWAIGVLGSLFPGITDFVMQRMMWRSQMTDSPRDPRRGSSLYAPQPDGEERGGRAAFVLEKSPFTAAQMNPWQAAFGAFVASALIGNFIRKRV